MEIIQNEFNVQTGETTQKIVQESESDKKARLLLEKQYEEKLVYEAQKAAEKTAVLAKLGLTHEEVTALLS